MNGLELHDETPTADAMARYKTRERASVPRRVFLYDPGTGVQTEDYIEIRSSLSEEFRVAKDKALQESGEAATLKDPALRAERIRQAQLEMKASLIAGWSFGEYTEAKGVEFLREAPQVETMIIAVADDNESFFGKPSAG